MSLILRRMVLDTNYLRNPLLETYFRDSSRNEAILCDYIFIEMLKGDPILAVPRSTQILRKYPRRVKVLKRTFDIARIEKYPPHFKDLVHPGLTGDFIRLCKYVDLAQNGYHIATKHIAEMQSYARWKLGDSFKDPVGWLRDFDDNSGIFRRHDLRCVRDKLNFDSLLKTKIIWLTCSVFGVFGDDELGRHARRPVIEATQSYLFRYVLCMVLFGLEWLANGKQYSTRPERVLNDLVDANIAAFGTMFDGVLTSDEKMLRVYNNARTVLSYVSEVDTGVMRSLVDLVPNESQHWPVWAFFSERERDFQPGKIEIGGAKVEGIDPLAGSSSDRSPPVPSILRH